eukprot:GEMP01075940.1.p1 GENE.GEMP01075940.1~~GEMP01075940.1.p1  ORF type:complete len:298 (+),score=55.57 GEMP01075940.1:133-1026(+)
MFAVGLTMRQMPSYKQQWGSEWQKQNWNPRIQLKTSVPVLQAQPGLQTPQPQPGLKTPQPPPGLKTPQPRPGLKNPQPQSPVRDETSRLQQDFKGKSGEDVILLLTEVLSPTQMAAVTKVFSRRNAVQRDIQKGASSLRHSLGTINRSELLSAIRWSHTENPDLIRNLRAGLAQNLPRMSQQLKGELLKAPVPSEQSPFKWVKPVDKMNLMSDIRCRRSLKARRLSLPKELKDELEKPVKLFHVDPPVVRSAIIGSKVSPGRLGTPDVNKEAEDRFGKSILKKPAALHTEINWFASR